MWKMKKPNYGDQIRVNRGLYYHHGIYVSDNEVIQYASPKGSEISPETALIISTTLDEFLKGEARFMALNKLNPNLAKELFERLKEYVGELEEIPYRSGQQLTAPPREILCHQLWFYS